MDLFTSIILGIVQGLTEFIPVSSSGHLVIFQKIIPGFSQPGVLFDVILHLGTLFAVLVYFRRKIFSLLTDRKYLTILVVGTFPAVVIGFLFKHFLESTFEIGGWLLGLQFFVTAALCYFTDTKSETKKEIDSKDAFWIGLAQAFAILPAVSRSGATIFTAVSRGIKRKEAAEFSFLLSVPAILGANVLEIITYKETLFPLPPSYFVGFVVSFFVGMLSIFLTLKLLYKKMFRIFALYTLLLGVVVIFVT